MILTLLEILRLKSGPQDMPAGRSLAVLLALIYVAQGFLADKVVDEPDAIPRTILAIAVQFGIIATLLNIKGLLARVSQTISALSGTGFILGLISIILLMRVDPEIPQPDLALVYIALFIWSLVVDAHIYRQALSIKMSTGVLVAVMIFAINFVLLKAVFG